MKIAFSLILTLMTLSGFARTESFKIINEIDVTLSRNACVYRGSCTEKSICHASYVHMPTGFEGTLRMPIDICRNFALSTLNPLGVPTSFAVTSTNEVVGFIRANSELVLGK